VLSGRTMYFDRPVGKRDNYYACGRSYGAVCTTRTRKKPAEPLVSQALVRANFRKSEVRIGARRIVSSLLRRPRSSSTDQRVKVITRHASRPVASSCTSLTDPRASSPEFILYRRFTDIHYPLTTIFTPSGSFVCFSNPCYAVRCVSRYLLLAVYLVTGHSACSSDVRSYTEYGAPPFIPVRRTLWTNNAKLAAQPCACNVNVSDPVK